MLFDYNRLRKEQKDKILTKWGPFLKGIESPILRESTAMLLENEAQYLLEEPATQAADVVGIQKILLPIVRRVFPNLIANNIVSVQPLAGPTGVIFYLKYKFGSTKSETLAGSEYSMYSDQPSDVSQGYNPYYSTDEVRETTVTFTDGGGAAVSTFDIVSDANYRDGLDLGADSTDATNGLLKRVSLRFKAAVTATPANYSVWVVRYNGNLGQWVAKEIDRGGTGVVLASNASDDTAFKGITVGTDWDSSTGALPKGQAQWVHATKKVVFSPFVGVNTDNGANITITGIEMLYTYKQEGTEHIPEMAISISQYPITVKSRKLKATWTNEAEQDLKAYHGLNADAELTALVSNEMIAEIDREIVGKCLEVAPISSYRYIDWNSDVANNTSGNYLDRHRNLVQTITELSNEIYRKSKIGPANWIVTSPKVASYLETLEGFIAAPAAIQGGLGIVKAGTYRGNFTVYKDPLFPANKILCGHKSPASPFGAGVVYAPYVTQITPTLYGPNDFTPRKGFIARYGLIDVPLGNLLYGMISIADLPGSV